MMDLFQNPSSLKSNRFQTAVWAAKLVLMFMGVMSILFLLKVSIIPYTFNLVVSTLPRLWASARSWLTLPFVYIIVNFIIITIAASSNFHNQKSGTTPFSDSPASISDPKKTDDENITITEPENQSNEELPTKEEVKKVIQEQGKREKEEEKVEDFNLSFNKVITDPLLEKCTNDYFLPDSDDKSGDDNDDTLEATWRAIMEGQGKTMKPQLKKSDTWSGGGGGRIAKAEPFHNNGDGGGGGGDDDDPVAWAKKELRKSDTFSDRASLRREKSMTPEELNLRAEAFIRNFNNQMKLQRLESYQRFMEMVNQSA